MNVLLLTMVLASPMPASPYARPYGSSANANPCGLGLPGCEKTSP